MTPDEQRDLVRRHYALNAAGDHAAARELLTDDFTLTIPLPFGGTFTGKDAFAEAIPRVMAAVAVDGLRPVATTVGDGYAVEVVEFTFAGDPEPTEVAELITFRGDKICAIKPFYADASRFVAAAARRAAGQ